MALMNDMWPRLHHTTHTLQKQNTTRHLPVNQTHHSLRNLHWIWMHVLMNNATARLWWYFILIVLKTQLASCAIPQAVNKEHKEHIKGVVYFGAWQGLSNQRQCVINAIIMAERLGYAVLLPQLRLNFLANDANDHLVPFSYLYKVSKIRNLAKKHSVAILESTHQLPDDLLFSCLSQLARIHGPWPPVVDHLSRNTDFWRQVLVTTKPESWPRTMCLDEATAYMSLGYIDIKDIPVQNNVSQNQLLTWDEVDNAFEASELITQEVENIMDEVEAKYGTRAFVSLHLRTEGDWVAYCLNGERPDDLTTCFVDDELVGRFLRDDEKLPRNTLVFVSSGHAPLPSLCNGYRCFQVDDVWRKRGAFFKQHPVRELHALLDYNLALRGESFYGNQHSTFSAHLFMAFARMHRPSRAYNADCKNEEDCRRVPDMYKVPECIQAHDITACEAAIQALRAKLIHKHFYAAYKRTGAALGKQHS